MINYPEQKISRDSFRLPFLLNAFKVKRTEKICIDRQNIKQTVKMMLASFMIYCSRHWDVANCITVYILQYFFGRINSFRV